MDKTLQSKISLFGVQMRSRLQSCLAACKPIASVLITVPLVIGYICFGAVVFLQFEPPLQWQNKAKLPTTVKSIKEIYSARIYNATLSGDSAQVEADLANYTQSLINIFIDVGRFDTDSETFSNENWTFIPAALQSLCLITAIGSCVNTPPTTSSQAFALLYALLGIPLSCLTIANIGKHLGILLVMLIDKIGDRWRSYRSRKEMLRAGSEEYFDSQPVPISLNDKEIPHVSLRLIFTCFCVYLIFGALLLPDFFSTNIISSTFSCFVSLSTVAISESHTGYIIIFYLLGGLVLTTVALEVAANYLRKLHFKGRAIGNCRSVRIHFGSKDLSVSELIWSFGRHHKIDQSEMIEFLGMLDEFVQTTIAEKENGKFQHLCVKQNYFSPRKLRINSSEILYADQSIDDLSVSPIL